MLSDYGSSYKGFVSFIIVGFVNRVYLVDCLVLREHIGERLKKILENTEIFKFSLRLGRLMEEVKR